MKLFGKIDIYPVVVIVLSFIANIATYSYLPDRIPIHWNYRGIIDDYGPKMPYAFIGTILGTAMLILFELLPIIDPKKDNYQRFKKPYSIIRDALITFSAGIGLMPYFTKVYVISDPSRYVFAALSLLFIIFGNYMGQLKQNWYAGIKTPWTLSNETVWNKTHRVAGKLMTLSGLLTLVSLVLGLSFTGVVFTITTFTWGVGSVIYSYVIFKIEKSKH